MKKRIIYAICLLFATHSYAQKLKGSDLIKDVEAKLYSQNMTFNLKMEKYEGTEVKSSYLMRGDKKGGKFRIEFLEPSVAKGRCLLNDGDSLWMYLPLSGRTMLLSSKQAFMGSDASNSDVLRISLEKEYNVVSVTNAAQFVILTLAAKNLETSYKKIRIYLKNGSLLPMKQELLSISEKVIRTIYYSSYKTIDGALFPMTISINDELKKGTKTVLTHYSVSRSCNKPDEYFKKVIANR